MGASVVCCRDCRRPLADRYPDGRLRVHAFTAVDAYPSGEHGPFVRLFCECGAHRDYTLGAARRDVGRVLR